MAVSVKSEPLPKSQMGLEISVDAEECQAAWNKAIREISKSITVDGFRKGKVPKQIIESRYAGVLKSTACEKLVETSVEKALKETDFRAIGQVSFSEENAVADMLEIFSPTSELSFKVAIDVWPECTFSSSYEGLEISAEDVPFDETIVTNALEELRKKESFSVISPEGSTADYGNLCVIDMTGYYEKEDGTKGEPLPSLAQGDNIEVSMERGKFFAGFVEGLLGASTGETREVHIEFPAQNPNPQLAGHKAVFDVTINAIKDVVMPDLDDEFAQKVSENDTMEQLRAQIKERLDTESDVARGKNVDKAFEDKLAEIVQVDLPETLLEEQMKKNFANMMAGFSNQGMSSDQIKAMVTKENFELYKERGLDKAVKALKVNFAMTEIAKVFDIKASEEEVQAQIELAKIQAKGEPLDEEAVKDQVESQLERNMVLGKLKETATISYFAPLTEQDTATPAAEQTVEAEVAPVQ